MLPAVPSKLKTQDISRFATRGAQLEKLKPAIAYWSYYWIVNQILAKGLHNVDDECKNYTTALVDKLEQMKVEYASDDAIIDDVAGQATVEQFGLETFQRADNAVRANKASRQTAETFQAAATFLDVVQVWGPPSPEIAAKIKFAKFHALRIARAIKAGEDPNLSNPEPEPQPSAESMELDPNDPEVQLIQGGGPAATQQPTAEDVPDAHDALQRRLAGQSAFDQSIHPSRDSSRPRTPPVVEPSPSSWHPTSNDHDVSPPQVPSRNSRQNSVGGGYFPNVSPPSEASEPNIHNADVPTLPDLKMDEPSAPSPQDFYNSPPPSKPSVPLLPTSDLYPQAPPPQSYTQPAIPAPQALAPNPQPVPAGVQNYLTDDTAVIDAQKHAKWAISALNFEDVPTAVRELRHALQCLGAR